MYELFKAHLRSSSISSGKTSSYLSALKNIGPILAKSKSPFSGVVDIWRETSPVLIHELYRFAIEQQKLPGGGIFSANPAASYWKKGFYSAALRAYGQFLVERQYEEALQAASQAQASGPEVAKALEKVRLGHAELLVEENAPAKEGKDALRQTRVRLNQRFFRKMILGNYGARCAVSGLPLPEALRASHITAWSEDAPNRLNPCNGICLSAIHDAAFDRHLISFDNAYRLILSPRLRAQCAGAEAFHRFFGNYEGKRLELPGRFKPDLELLERHREKMPE